MKYSIILLLLVGFATFNTFSYAYAGVPVEKVPITSFEAHSIDGKQIDKVMMGQQVTFVSNVENTQDTNQSFVYGVWIENQKGERVFEDWIDATLEPKSSFSPSIIWSPTETGNFTAEASVWKSNDNPTAFSAVWSVVLEVSMMDNDAPFDYVYPLKQFKSGIEIEEIQCRDSLILVIKYDGSPACVKSATKQHLMDRGWAEPVIFDEIKNNSELLKQNIIRMEDGRISLYPENTCASINVEFLADQDIQRYKNDDRGLNEDNVLQITSDDFNEIPIVEELIFAVNLLEFPYNQYSSAELDGLTFVEYEFFLMEKAIEKYGDSQSDYFIKLDKDYKERFSNPAKQGFTNTFEAPLIVYHNKTYSIGETVFWTSDEHEPMRMTVYPVDETKDKKSIVLTDEDMKSVPKIKQAIENIGTVQESINGIKGLPEDQWNEYREWFKKTSKARLNADGFRLVELDEHLYSVSFVIC